MELVLVGIGGFAGAVARRVVDVWITERAGSTFPFGTLVGLYGLWVLFSKDTERLFAPPGLSDHPQTRDAI